MSYNTSGYGNFGPFDRPITPSKRYLVYDEVIDFASKRGIVNNFRVRVWRGKDATPVVFVTPNGEHGDQRPQLYACVIANWINQAILRWSEFGLLYFDVSYLNGVPVVYNEEFAYAGNHLRLRMYKPKARVSNLQHLSWVVGEPVSI